MKAFMFSESQQELLSVIMIEHIMEIAVSMRPQDAEQRAAFADMAAIVAELHNTDKADINTVVPARYDIQFTDGQTIADPILENGFDPRARNPYCVHGVAFSESCEQCAKNWTDERLRTEGEAASLVAHSEAVRLTGVNGDER